MLRQQVKEAYGDLDFLLHSVGYGVSLDATVEASVNSGEHTQESAEASRDRVLFYMQTVMHQAAKDRDDGVVDVEILPAPTPRIILPNKFN